MVWRAMNRACKTMNNIPNFISVVRLLMAPLTVWLILDNRLDVAFWVFVAAGLSDALDGFLARRFEATSEFGEFLDPIADKTLLVCIYVTLGVQGLLPSWLVILVVTRDALIVGAHLLAAALGTKIPRKPLLVGKLNTLGQITLAALVLGKAGLSINFDAIVPWLGYIVGVTTVISGVLYLIRCGRAIAQTEDAT